MAASLLMLAALSSSLGWGRVPVARVALEAPGASSVSELLRIFGVVEGEPLSRSEIRAGIQALLASGEVEDAVVSIVEGADGAEVRVALQIASRVSSVVIAGLPRPIARRVAGTLNLTRGAPLAVATFETNLERAKQWLQEEGYREPRLEPDLSFDVPHGTVAVRVTGELGRPVVLRALAAPELGEAETFLWRRCGVKPGQRVTVATQERARRRLVESLRRDGFWEADAEVTVVEEGSGGVLLRLSVRRGPHYRLELVGLKRSRALELEALPFLRGEEPFSEAALELAVRRVRLFFQRQGRLTARAHGELAADGADTVLRLHVERGPLTPILAIRFPGLSSLSERLLRERIGARKGHFWRWGGEPVDEDTLAADATSLLGTLQEAGFADARVEPPRVVPERGGVAIELTVYEGQRRLVEEVAISGAPSGVELPGLALVNGGPWSVAAEAAAREAVQAALEDAGYADARTTSAHDCVAGRCRVTITVQPGLKVEIARVVVAGLGRTRRWVVQRVAGLQEGEPLGPASALAAQRRLLALGIFQRATVRTIPHQESGARRGVMLDLTEGPTRTFALGLGWDTEEKARVSASWSDFNVAGTARAVSFQGKVSSRTRLVEASYREPARLGLFSFPTWVSAYHTEESFPSFKLTRRGMWLEIGDRVKRPARTLLRYDYQIVNPEAPPEVLSALERDKQHLAIASLTPVLEWDTRDDPFSPKHGVLLSVQLQTAFKLFLSDASFDKLTALATAHGEVAGGVLVGSLRGGAIQPQPHPHGTCNIEASPGACANLAIPISVRLFGGGRVSHRAFATDRLGILGKTLTCPEHAAACPEKDLEPVGGAGQLLASLEWRFPVLGVFGADLFLDGGNTWAAWRDVRVAELRWGAGMGLRVETPVGPLRLEYGWKLDRKRYETPGQLFLSFGNPF